MKTIVALALVTLVYCEDSFYNFTVKDAKGKDFDLSKYKGQVSLVVNVASQCGYTDGHYKALKLLDEQFSLTGRFNVLAFPCNQFGAQEPDDLPAIQRFTREVYSVNFPIFDKINVIENNVPKAWQFLIAGASNTAPNWNFWKYLVNHEGKVLNAWGPWTEVHAAHPEIQRAIDAAVLAANPEAFRQEL